MKKLFVIIIFLALFTLIAQAKETPKAECENLMNQMLPIAEKMLIEHGEFYPYGGVLKKSGKTSIVDFYDGQEHPLSKDVIRQIKEIFAHGAKTGEYNATVLIYDVKVLLPVTNKKSDAIAVSLNHRDNYSVIVLFPYELKDGQIIFGETFTKKGEYDIFKK